MLIITKKAESAKTLPFFYVIITQVVTYEAANKNQGVISRLKVCPNEKSAG
jgi:hypothetical protein